ncbi:hypothetical protein [uncultured Clostridium sp.]|uniref:hypothetical protein n=1 Tax=uncultured Clostridium sp. TaxID=59620 RepID=UPI0025E3F30D|nr:hypothetical protein [uncultured Clostridium sp.]
MFYKLTLADKSDIEDIYKLIEQRITWMNEVGIKQWNVINYCDIYTREYFINKANNNNLYVLKQIIDDRIVGSIVCLETDEIWKDSPDIPSYYLHNFVTDKTAIKLELHLLN